MDDRTMLEMVRLREVLRYDEASGLFTWLVSNSNCVLVGAEAGRRLNSNGYKEIQIDGRLYKAHRLAWLYVYGVWPDQIDHMNGDREDNRIVNLRSVSSVLNTHNQLSPHKNNRSGFLGVSIRPNGKFQADIRVGGKKRHLGSFSRPEDAHAAYVEAKRKFHGGSLI